VDILLAALGNRVTGLVQGHVKSILNPMADYLRRVSIGVMLIVLSSSLIGVMLFALLVALFFGLSPYHALAYPALWVALVAFVLGLLTLVSGLRLVRRPK
jgi:ABC-type polysaccharide/polyol phosphate export permease